MRATELDYHRKMAKRSVATGVVSGVLLVAIAVVAGLYLAATQTGWVRVSLPAAFAALALFNALTVRGVVRRHRAIMATIERLSA